MSSINIMIYIFPKAASIFRKFGLYGILAVSGVASAVMPTSYPVGLSSGGSVVVSSPAEACSAWVSDYNKTYSEFRRYNGMTWVGFRTYTDGNGNVNTFDGATQFSVVCKGSWQACMSGGGPTCGAWETQPIATASVSYGRCPTGTQFSEAAQDCVCRAGMTWEPSVGECRASRDKNTDKKEADMCVGHPIYPLTGAKSKVVALLTLPGLQLNIEYSTRKALGQTNVGYGPGHIAPPPAGAGPLWSLNVQKVLLREAPSRAIFLGAEKWDSFADTANQDGWSSITYGSDLQLFERSGYVHARDKLAAKIYTFSPYIGTSPTVTPLIGVQSIQGHRLNIVQTVPESPNGWRPVPVLNTIKDSFGREVQFAYDIVNAGPAPRLRSITSAAGRIDFAYHDSGMLQSITWPDGSSKRFSYVDSNPDQYWALTGIQDENGVQSASYTYDSSGRATSTQLAGGVDAYQVTQWQTPPTATITRNYDAVTGIVWFESKWSDVGQLQLLGPNNQSTVIQSKLVNGMPRITSQSQPAGSGCAASVKSQDYDANGNVAWKEDFKGFRTCFANDLSRNLETSRVEGLAKNTGCDAVLVAGAALPGNARRISTEWHPVWRLETRIAEPRRLTSKVYNGQPDPFNGGATASCAPASATLPDGSPIVVLCKQVEQVTSDLNGAQGFAAPLANGAVLNRVQQWTYNEYGQVLTYVDPLKNTTTNTYYTDTTAEHTLGDLWKVTNALNQVTTYTKYNAAGQWLEMVDANGIATTRTFDLRQRLKSVSTAGLTTSYDYWPTGLLKSVSLPGGSAVSYGYDDAQRLTTITDNLGNKITYTLDASGNRTAETITDPTGKLAKTLSRLPDALNRIQQVTGRE